MAFFRKHVFRHRWIALCAAYAVFFHAFFGGIVLGKHVGVDPFVICYGAGDSGGDGKPGTLPIKHLPCSLCSPVHGTATLTAFSNSIDFVFVGGTQMPILPIAISTSPYEDSPRLSQGPPPNA